MSVNNYETRFHQVFDLSHDTFPAKNTKLGLTSQSWMRLAFTIDGANRRGIRPEKVWKVMVEELMSSLKRYSPETVSIISNLVYLFIGLVNLDRVDDKKLTFEGLKKMNHKMDKYLDVK